jgi:hypothetical protein
MTLTHDEVAWPHGHACYKGLTFSDPAGRYSFHYQGPHPASFPHEGSSGCSLNLSQRALSGLTAVKELKKSTRHDSDHPHSPQLYHRA